ncbi:hypothetical protein [Permianibacter aggregans]|uniref:Uncharacterized protein n=1 Tax=Permianibacter aggregans TaxID=1510150 RepID=A0A4V3D8E1_9GAMM|nr:hypothetical protein [Permianibacter aggregans]QGX41504.1 hypothetical protein E2H98_18240 [Permianibacter aggregans]TDQ51297.1 hypothetical protein EV696_101271 [Permianibacter aggregans]
MTLSAKKPNPCWRKSEAELNIARPKSPLGKTGGDFCFMGLLANFMRMAVSVLGLFLSLSSLACSLSPHTPVTSQRAFTEQIVSAELIFLGEFVSSGDDGNSSQEKRLVKVLEVWKGPVPRYMFFLSESSCDWAFAADDRRSSAGVVFFGRKVGESSFASSRSSGTFFVIDEAGRLKELGSSTVKYESSERQF